MILEDGSWHIQWADEMMLPELANGNYLELVIETPARGETSIIGRLGQLSVGRL